MVHMPALVPLLRITGGILVTDAGRRHPSVRDSIVALALAEHNRSAGALQGLPGPGAAELDPDPVEAGA